MPNAAGTRMNPREWLMLFSLALVWGATYMFNEVILREVGTLLLVMGRLGLGALILLAIIIIQGIPLPRSREVWGAFAVMGFINNVLPFCMVVWGQNYISGALAAILNSTTPPVHPVHGALPGRRGAHHRAQGGGHRPGHRRGGGPPGARGPGRPEPGGLGPAGRPGRGPAALPWPGSTAAGSPPCRPWSRPRGSSPPAR